MNAIEKLHKAQMKNKHPQYRIGDTLKVSLRIVEGGRERLQAFTGLLIGRNGKGATASITLRRISFGEGVERVLPIHSPRIEKIEVMQKGQVRRAKLYYLREKIGKGARVKELAREQLSQKEAAPVATSASIKEAVLTPKPASEATPVSKPAKESKEDKQAESTQQK